MTLFNQSLLSEKKIMAINSIKMNTVDKIFLFYEDMTFFPAQIEAIHPIFLLKNENIDEQFENYEDNWQSKVSSFNRFYDNILMVWITGKAAHHVEKLDDETIANRLTDLLRKLLNNCKIPLPNKIIK
jgi:hypothetical protein